jgi:hypothetical protein
VDDGGHAALKGASFRGNRVRATSGEASGGAVKVSQLMSGKLQLNESSFFDNVALVDSNFRGLGASGGALSVGAKGRVGIFHTTFGRNSAGGVSIYDSSSILASNAEEMRARQAGHVEVAGTVELVNCSLLFDGDEQVENGPRWLITVLDSGRLNAADCLFQNSAETSFGLINVLGNSRQACGQVLLRGCVTSGLVISPNVSEGYPSSTMRPALQSAVQSNLRIACPERP